MLIIPEDPTYNGAILRPLVSRILEDCGKSNAKVTVLADRKAAGFDHVCGLMTAIMERYAHMDLLLFIADADGQDRSGRLKNLEAEAARMQVNLICCAAKEEIEVWLLAGHIDKLPVQWKAVRSDISVKENVFRPFLMSHGNPRAANGGRDVLMRETLQNYRGLLERCPELADLRDRNRQLMSVK